MNKHFKLFLEILTFGVPLIIRVLSKARKFQNIANSNVIVAVNMVGTPTITIKDVRGNELVTLLVDEWQR